MQNVQNAAEIQQRVINLVEFYRTKVGKESQIAKDAKAFYDDWQELNNKKISWGGDIFLFQYQDFDNPNEQVWIEHLMVNEQLLGHFYSVVAGEDAEKDVLDQLLPEVYDKTILSKEEETFLANHFKEMVNYIILTPCDEDLKWVNRHDGKDAYTIPEEVLELIKSRVDIAPESRVYYPNTLFAQLANLFEGCTIYCDTMFYAWTKIALYANGIKAEDNGLPSSYDAIISYIPKDNADSKAIARLCDAYKNLPVNGKLVLLCPSSILAGVDNASYKKELSETLWYKELEFVRKELDEEDASLDANARFRKVLVEDKSIYEIIQLPQVMSDNASFDTYCLLIAEKGRLDSDVVLIDARVASNDFDTKHHMMSFDNAKFNTILQNDGIDLNTGLRKMVKVSSEELSLEILIPQVYVIERPSGAEYPVPLSSLCSLVSAKVRDVQFDLPEDTPWISMSDLTPLYTGDLDMSGIRKADCPNNPPYVEGSKEYGFGKDGKFVDSFWDQIGKFKGCYVLDYRECTYFDGKSDAVLYEQSAESGVQVAVVRATGKPYAVSSGILVFCPKEDFDVNSLAALLRLPVVYRQLIAYQQYGLYHHLNDILVPTDKRIIGDELYRMKREESVTNELGDKVQTIKTEYINEVRMRKHDMRPHMKQLNSSKNLMQHYIDNMSTLDDVQIHLNHQLTRFGDALRHLSDIIEHLSDEEKFGEPERFPIIEHLQGLITEYNRNGYNITFNYKEDKAKEYLKNKIEYYLDNIKEFETEKRNYPFPLHFSYALISPLDFDRMVQNIIENARTHGFTDASKADYKIWINLDIDEKRDMYQIDFSNNGQPLPEGMTKARYGMKGEKAGRYAGTGSGGYIVKSIVNHYRGDYDIFCKEGITTVRILLPIATI